ncbi:glycine betaine ABC transporter substrate-binding protein [Devosia sp. CN2-171]|jgi:glycine betaine/proline transport system substrate-binding protein|uniref:ABC transporter substrate-binding protein n=1 Tax=Devosia sp. CN2-171 TaxID=3400909 RepID=UPI003BF887E4
MRIFAAALALWALPMLAEADELKIGLTAWPSAQVTGYIIGQVAAERLGVDPSYVERGSMGLLSGIARGEIDVYPELWSPNLDAAVARYADAITVSPRTVAAHQGICVTKATAEQTGIAALGDLARPEIAGQFDSDGDSKGEIWIGDHSWFSTNVERVRAKSLGYDKTMTLLEAPEELAMAAVDAAVATDKPLVFYCYEPHHLFQLHEVVLLDEAPHDPSRWHIVAPADDPNWLSVSGAETGWAESSLSIGYASALAERLPAAASLLAGIQFEAADLAAMSYAVEVEGKAPADVAKAWVAANADRIAGWLK